MTTLMKLVVAAVVAGVVGVGVGSTARAATYSWNTTSGTWDTNSANWSGAGTVWADGSDAVFTNGSGYTVTLNETRSGGGAAFGSTNANVSWTLTGGALQLASNLTFQGLVGNGGGYGANPTLLLNSAVAVAGDLAVGRANLTISGGTVGANRIASTSGTGFADWGNVTISGGAVTATNGVDGSVGTTATFALNLNGGTLYTPFLKVADREAGPNNNAWLTFNGGTVVATRSTNAFITLYGDTAKNTYVGNGGAIFDTAGYDITVGVSLKTSGSGGLTKLGLGTLTLSNNASTYTGNTIIKAGKLIAGTVNGQTGISGGTAVLLGDTNGSANATLQLGASTSTTYGNNITVQSGNGGLMTINGIGHITQTGTLTLGSTNSAGKSVTLTNEGDPSWIFHPGVIQDPVGLTAGTAGTVTIGTVTNKGRVQYDVANTYSGNTRIAFGPFVINHVNGLQNSTLDLNAADFGTPTFNQNSTLGGLTGSRNLDMGTRTLSIGNNGQTNTYSGVLSNGTLVKIGGGALILSGANIHSNTVMSAGTLVVSNQLALQNSTVNYTNGAVEFGAGIPAYTLGGLTGTSGLALTNAGGAIALTVGNNGGSTTYGGVLSQSGSLIKAGAGALTLTNASTHTGGTTLSAGQLNLGHAAAVGSGRFTLGGGTLDNTSGGTMTLANNNVQTWSANVAFAGTADLNLGTGAVDQGTAARTVTVNARTLTVGGAITNSGGITKAGAGTLALAGANTFTGALTVNGGKVILSNHNTPGGLAIGNTAATAGALYITGGTVTHPGSSSHEDFAVDGYGYLNVSGGTLTGAAIWQGAQGGSHAGGVGVIAQTGGMFIQSGQPFVLGGLNNTGGRGVFNMDGGTSTVNSTMGSGWDTSTSSGRGEFNISGGSVTANEFGFKGAVTGVLNLRGGTLAVQRITTYTLYSNALTVGYVNFNGGTLQATLEGATLINLATANTQTNVFIHAGGATIDSNGKNVSIANALNAPGGDGISNIVLSTTGAGYIGEPAVVITGGGGAGATARAQFDPVSGTVTNILITNPGTGYTGDPTVSLSGGGFTTAATLGSPARAANVSGGLTKIGTGMLTLWGANTYTGPTVISAGTLQLGDGTSGHDGTIAAASTVSNNAALIYNTYGSSTAGHALRGSGSVTKIGAGTLTLTNVNQMATVNINGGTLAVNGGSNAVTNGLNFNNAGSTLLIQSGSMTVSGQRLLTGTGGNIAINMTGGALSVNGSATENSVGDNGTAAITLSGAAAMTVSGYLNIGVRGATPVTVGGASTLNVDTWSFGWQGTSVEQGGSSLTVADTGTFTATSRFALNGQSNETVNLNGGTFRTVAFDRANAGGALTLNLNGGTLQANGAGSVGSLANFLRGVDNAVVQAGGAKFDTAGYDITVTNALADGGAGGGLTKTGAGTLTLSAANSYYGVTLVSSGTLALAASGSIANSATLSIGSGATVDVSAANGYTLGSGQTLNGNGAVVGGLIMGAGSTLSPGNSTGTNYFNNALTLNGNTNAFELIDLLDHDQTVVTAGGSLTLLNKPILAMNLDSYLGNMGDAFTIFDNQFTDPVSGTFWLDADTPLADNAIFSVAGTDLRINYNGVTGNDITLTVVPEPATVGLLGLTAFAALWRRRLTARLSDRARRG